MNGCAFTYMDMAVCANMSVSLSTVCIHNALKEKGCTKNPPQSRIGSFRTKSVGQWHEEAGCREAGNPAPELIYATQCTGQDKSSHSISYF